jgi:hypothetical protein
VGITNGEECVPADTAACAAAVLDGQDDTAKTAQCEAAGRCVYTGSPLACVAADVEACGLIAIGEVLSRSQCEAAGSEPGACAYTPVNLATCTAEDAVICGGLIMDALNHQEQCEAAGRCTYTPADTNVQPNIEESCAATDLETCTDAIAVEASASVCTGAGACTFKPAVVPPVETIECNGRGSCVGGSCICETGYYGLDCATKRFSKEAPQPRINILAPTMNEMMDRSPINISFSVANRAIPTRGRVYLFVDGLPYPDIEQNRLMSTADLKIYGLYRGKHTAQLVLTDEHGTPLNTDVVYFEVMRPGGCANDCSFNGVCVERLHGQKPGSATGQYCVCHDGWMGVDCSTSYDYRLTPRPNVNFTAGGGLVEDLVRQMQHTIEGGLQDIGAGQALLDNAMGLNRAEVLAGHASVERKHNSFRNQMEAEVLAWKRRHQQDLEELRRNRDRVQRETETRQENNRRETTHSAEQHYDRTRTLHEKQQSLQNRLSRTLRDAEMQFALASDRLEHSAAKSQLQMDTIRHYDVSLNRINGNAQIDCDQDSYGNFECYYINFIKDCLTGDLMEWRAGDEMTPFPVKCPDDPGPPPLIRGQALWDGPADLLRESSGRVLPLQRPYSYVDEMGADLATKAPWTGKPRSDGLSEPWSVQDNVMTYRSDAPGWGEYGDSPTRPAQHIPGPNEPSGTTWDSHNGEPWRWGDLGDVDESDWRRR